MLGINAVLILNVGTSDLRLPEGVTSPKLYAAQLLAEPKGRLPDLEFPILTKYLAYVSLQRLKLCRVILVGTEQPETARPEHRAKDTLPVAQLMARWLMTRHPGQVAKAVVYRGNPSDWDTPHPFYQARLPQFAMPGARHLVGITGGTQAMNSNLVLAAMDCLPDIVLLTAVENLPQPRAVGLEQRLQARDTLKVIESHVKHWDFYAAHRLLNERSGLPPNSQTRRFCLALLQYADNRSCFRFQDAALALQDALADAPDQAARDLADRLVAEAAALADKDLAPEHPWAVDDQSQRLREMVLLADHYEKRGLLLEVPGLVYTFTDVALNLFADRLGVQFLDSKAGGGRRLNPEWVQAQPGLLEHFEKAKDEWARDFNTRVGLDLMDWYGRAGNSHAAKVEAELRALEAVRSLRNKGPLGHGTRGISKSDLEKAYLQGGSEAIITALRTVADLVAPGLQENPFELTSAALLRLLRFESAMQP